MNINETILKLLKGETVAMLWDDCIKLEEYIENEASQELQELLKHMVSLETTIGTIRTLDVYLKNLR